MKTIVNSNRRLVGITMGVAAILLIPLIAMQFSSGVNWSPIDFLVAGVLLMSTGLVCELVLRKVRTRRYRIVLVLAVFIALFLVWAELAVGLFGTRFAGS